jgi:polyhydroxyalkanoate synthesis repressor PhaR
MPIIKRYPNRKLYNTAAKRYITLDGIAELIRQGEDVQVVDHATGEDLTALTLSQVVFEQQKKHAGFLPQTLLAGLIRTGGDTLSMLRRGLFVTSGLGGYVDEVIERRISRLVRRGAFSPEEGGELLLKLLRAEHGGAEVARPGEERVARILAEQGVPTREDLEQIEARLDALAAKLEEMESA